MEGRRGDVRRPDETRALIAGLVLARLPAPGPRLLTWSLVAAWCLLGAVPAATRQPQAGGPPFRFVDVSAPSHLTRELLAGRPDKDHLLDSAGAGIAFLDYDRDGRLDVFMPNGWRLDGSRVVEKGRFALYHGLPDGTFEDVTDRAGVGGDGAWGTGAFVADVDGDGWPDIFVTCFGRNILYRNQGNGTFANIAREAGLESPGWNTGAAFFDADGDGDLDIYIAAYIAQSIDDVLNAKRTLPWKGVEMVANGPFGMTGAPDHFFRNEGHGRFTDATDEAGFTDKALGFGFAVRAADLDGDGLVDVYVANDSDPNYLYRNEGKGHFKEVATWAGCALDEKGASQASMGIALGDVNGDGVLDVFVTNFSEDFATLYAGGPGGIFEDVSRATGIGPMTYKPLKWGTAFADSRQRRRSRRRRRQRPHLPAGRSASGVHRHVRAAELRRRESRQGSAAVSRHERDGRSRIRGGRRLPGPRGRGLRQRRGPRPAVHAAGRPARSAPERQPGARGVADRHSRGVPR